MHIFHNQLENVCQNCSQTICYTQNHFLHIQIKINIVHYANHLYIFVENSIDKLENIKNYFYYFFLSLIAIIYAKFTLVLEHALNK